MATQRLGTGLLLVAALTAAALAVMWLVFTEPLTMADALATGDVSPIARVLAGVLYDMLLGLLAYL